MRDEIVADAMTPVVKQYLDDADLLVGKALSLVATILDVDELEAGGSHGGGRRIGLRDEEVRVADAVDDERAAALDAHTRPAEHLAELGERPRPVREANCKIATLHGLVIARAHFDAHRSYALGSRTTNTAPRSPRSST